jgi:large subunit ribosomal protein L17
MKHLKQGRKFSRKKDQRKAMLKTMLGSFLMRGKITTTEAKAKELKRISDSLIHKCKQAVSLEEKRDNLAAIRFLSAHLPKNIKSEQIKKIAERFATRKSGFSRVIKKGSRRSDSAKMASIEMVEG